jgi:hypothetical protein
MEDSKLLELDDIKITFENFCDKYNIVYLIKPYAYDKKRNVIEIPQRTIYPKCVICIGNCLMAKKLINKPLSNEMINYLTTFSGHNITINNIIDKVYNYINSGLSEAYLVIFVTYNQIYFQIIDRLFEKYVLLQNKAYTTHILFCFHHNKLNYNKLMFDYKFKEYEFNDDNLSKIVKLYKDKYAINQKIQNMYYKSHDNGTYYIKGGSFGEPILEFEIKTNNLENVYIEFNNNIVNIDKLDNIVKTFNMYRIN